ncbi:uncharacterized protein LOC123441115 [Hordeum vulgare subsp. vulgare]|uniref:Predicted protein n=1 Tax=Hordeum vulgare subsp. vulgare TaxID=112509 RepID=F2EBF3_HORVV|nr:uncharacterized protein LOC123441115 [Hordeum vulgare subsp. vulgare]BAK04675.1 predicted protein [Hordeum vulgare subsp. vulgare]
MAALDHHLLVFILLALAASSSIISAAAAAADNDDVQLRKVAMSQAVKVLSRYSPETTDQETLKRALAVVNREAQRYWKPIFKNVNKVMDSGADHRSKEAAFAVAKELLNRELGQGPNAVKIDFEYV